ncbi:MAG: hypothetical protein RIB97_00955 [Nitratireductor sp.]
MRPPDKPKPAAGKAAGFQKIEQLSSKFDGLNHIPNPSRLQAARLRDLYCLPWPTARAIAEMVFQAGARP